MLHEPEVPDQALAAAVREEYALGVVEIAFLPLGADWNGAVYRVVADDGRAYFLKLRSGAFDDTGVVVSRLLHEHDAHVFRLSHRPWVSPPAFLFALDMEQ